MILADSPPPSPELHCSEQLLETIISVDYWRKLCPELTVAENKFNDKEIVKEKESVLRDLKADFCENGFFHLSENQVKRQEVCEKLARGVVTLIRYGWQPSFIFMYDEAWAIIEATQRQSLSDATGGSVFIGDIYAWYVDPRKGQKGWGPHRDRMGSGPNSFRKEDNTPMLSTSWLALTDAGPQNSCLYVVPAPEDPWYFKQDLPEIDPLAAIFKDKPDAFQSIRCLSAPAGSIWHFSHKIIHWGSFAKTNAKPRIAMSWVVGDHSFEKPAFPKENLPFPDIRVRLGLISGQMIAYGGQTNIRRGFKMLCYRIFKLEGHRLSEAYRDKVEYIFFCRPPPKNIQLKESTKSSLKLNPDEIIPATEEDDEKVHGIKSMFGYSSSSDSDE